MLEAEYVNYLLLVFGLLLGSFLNVVSLRYAPGKGVFDLKRLGGRSHCVKCGQTLRWYELVPVVSFIVQLGRCRRCRTGISFQYPIVEILSGLTLFFVPLVLAQFYTGGFYFFISAVWILAILILLTISVIDFRNFIIPDLLTVFLVVLGVVLAVGRGLSGNFGILQGSSVGAYALTFGLRESVWINHLVAAAVGVVFFGLIYVLTKGKAMGMGDVKLAGALGILMGWPDSMLALLISFMVGALFSLGLILIRGKHLTDHIPFGPFMAVGAALIFFFGEYIFDGYFYLSTVIFSQIGVL